MLVIFERQSQLKDSHFLRLDTIINADISSSLLLTIFGMDTPLHDGACLIKGGKIVAANCYIFFLCVDFSLRFFILPLRIIHHPLPFQSFLKSTF